MLQTAVFAACVDDGRGPEILRGFQRLGLSRCYRTGQSNVVGWRLFVGVG